MELLHKNKVDAAYLTLDEALYLKVNGVDISVVLVADTSVGADVFFSKPGIKTREQILGKTIAYEKNALGELMLHYFLQKYDFKKHQINTINGSTNEIPQLFNSGQAQIAISYYP